MIIPPSLRLPAAALLLGGGLLVLVSMNTSSVNYRDDDPAYNRAYWTEALAQHDARAVYAEFQERTGTLSLERQHLSAHIMGELIYAARGIDGITVCDASFGYGCYHGFFGRAISEGGDARVAELDAVCVAALGPLGTGCQHGIGHGILEYVGYDRVNDALALCEQTTQMVPLLGCASGVFMEYHWPLTDTGENLLPSRRHVTDETMYEPCDSVPQTYQDSCYYQLGEWFALGHIGDFSAVGPLCSTLSGSAREHCFLGAGAGITFASHFSLEETRAECVQFAADDERACRAGLSWTLYADPQYRVNAEAACAYDDASDEAYCLRLADLTQGKDAR